MDLVTICREEGRKQATEWLKGAIDAPNPYALMATGARNSAGAVSEEDFAELSAGDWLEMVWVHVHAGVREVITEAYWAKVGPMGVTQTLQGMFDELNARRWLTGGLPEDLDPYGGMIPPLQGTFDELA